MAVETEVFRLDLSDTIDQIVKLRAVTQDLKNENEQLQKVLKGDEQAMEEYGGTVEEATQALEQNNSQIRINNQTIKEHQKAIDNTSKLQAAAKGSIEANRKELALLTQQYIKLANPTKEQTQRIKDLSDRLKEQEGAIGDTRRNVGNYQEAIENALKGVKIFGFDVGQTINNLKEKQAALQQVTKGLGNTTGGLKVFRTALISTGIGALVVALGVLVNAFLSTQKGIDTLNKVLIPMQTVFARVTNLIEDVAVGAFDKLAEVIENPKQALVDLGAIIQENVINRIKAFAVAGNGLSQIIDGNFSGGLKTLANSFIQLNTGIEDGVGKLENLKNGVSDFVSDAVSDGSRIAELTIEIEEMEAALTASREEQLAQFEELKLAAADQTKSERERFEALTKAAQIRRKIEQEDLTLIDLRIEKHKLEKKGDEDLRDVQKETNELVAERSKIEREADSELRKITSATTKFLKEQADERFKNEALAFDKFVKDQVSKLLTVADEIENNSVELPIKPTIDVPELTQEVQKARTRLQNILQDEDGSLFDALGLSDLQEDKIQTAFDSANALVDGLASIATVQNQNALGRLEERRAAEIAAVEESVRDEEERARRIEEINQKFNDQKLKQEKDYQRKQKGVQIGQAIINGALAVTNALATVKPFLPLGVAAAALAATTTAIQVGTIAGQKFAEGGEVNVGGRSHAEGGTTYVGEDGNAFEVERGEKIFVMKRTASQEIDRYSKWNQLFGGKPWTTKVRHAAGGGQIATPLDGGFQATQSRNNVEQQLQVLKIPAPVVRVSEINRVQRNGEQSVNVSEL